MTTPHEEALTNREIRILEDGVPPHLNRYDIEDPPDCEHCRRAARYALVLGRCPDQPGMYVKRVCDVCLEQRYRTLELALGPVLSHD